MFKSSFIMCILVILSIYNLNAQIALDNQISKAEPATSSLRANPDVIFKVIGTGESHDHMILDLPEGASFEHIGEGIFHITGMPDDYGLYKIGMTAGGDILNGVTTVDMSLIFRHVMGNGSLDNDFKKIAADVDCDGRITVLDILQIRRAILDRITEFGCKTNYKFWPENLEFEWNGTPIDAGVYNSIKLADVNMSAIANSSSATHNDDH